MINREIIFQAAQESGFIRTETCCDGVKDKLCGSDQWHGNLEGFANALIRLIEKQNKEIYGM